MYGKKSTTGNYVAMEKHICIVCGQKYDTGNILLDKRLKDIPKDHEITGIGMCPEHQKLFDDGYVALIEVTNMPSENSLKLKDADRTGRIAHVSRSVANTLFNNDLGDIPMVYVEMGKGDSPGVIDKLQEMMQQPGE